MIFNVKVTLNLRLKKFMLKEGTFNQSIEKRGWTECSDFFAVICVLTLTEMTCAKDRYFSLNRILMLATGLWPYEQSKFIRLQLTFYYGILGSFIAFQVNKCIVFNRFFYKKTSLFINNNN